MTLTAAKSVSGLLATANATGPGVSWHEPLGATRTTALPQATTGYECAGVLGETGNTLVLVLATGLGVVTVTVDTALLANGNILYTAVAPGWAGNSITREITAAVARCFTTVTVLGKNIKVAPATKGRMDVSGLTPTTGTLSFLYAGLHEGKAIFTTDAANSLTPRINTGLLYKDGIYWTLKHWGASAVTPDVERQVADNAATPDLIVAAWAVGTGTGTPAIVAAVTSKAQVITAITACAGAAALITASADGTVTGAVVAAGATPLAGGFDASTLTGGDGNDIEGKAIVEMEAIIGLRITCTAGGFTLGVAGALPFPLTAGGVVHYANPDGADDLLDTLTLTATANNSAYNVVVMGA